jgi:hypothetical protein
MLFCKAPPFDGHAVFIADFFLRQQQLARLGVKVDMGKVPVRRNPDDLKKEALFVRRLRQ